MTASHETLVHDDCKETNLYYNALRRMARRTGCCPSEAEHGMADWLQRGTGPDGLILYPRLLGCVCHATGAGKMIVRVGSSRDVMHLA